MNAVARWPVGWRRGMKNATKLKTLVEQRRAITVPGAANGMFARAIDELGFEAAYATGAGIANMSLGPRTLA